MRARWLLLTTTIAVMVGVAPASALAATYTIFRTSDTSRAAGRCSKSGRLVCSSLRAFVLHAPSNSTARLSAGTYPLTDGELLFNRPGVVLTIQGASGGTTIQQTTPGSRVIQVVGESLVLDNLKVTGGKQVGTSVDAHGNGAGVGGGGISNNGLLILETATVAGNSVTGATGAAAKPNGPAGDGGVARGGGIDNIGTLHIDDSTIEGNTATGGSGGDGPSAGAGGAGQGAGAGGAGQGGGLSNGSSGAVVIGQGSKVLGNTATGGASGAQGTAAGGPGAGGGLWSEGRTYVSTDTISGNLAQPAGSPSAPNDAYGGAIFADDGTLEVQATTIADNQATTPAGTVASGGGAVATSAPTTIENSTITGNATSGSGGGIHAFGKGESIVSTTLSANSAGSDGGNLAASSGLDLGRTLISGGTASGRASNCSGGVTDRGHNLESTAPSQCGLATADQDLIGQDPLLGPLASNGGPTQTMALLSGSPAIDAGGSCANGGGYPLTVDQRASDRGGPCDIGAFEIRVAPTSQSAPTVSGAARPGQWLRCDPGTWSSPDSVRYFYSWLGNGRSISGADSQSYRVTKSDAGRALVCRVVAKNDDGYSAPHNSEPLRVA